MGSNRERAARFFADELGKIKDPEIREFVLHVYDVVCPDYFWQRAASSSGKYHPQFTLGDGGLARHVKYACYWFDQICRSILHDGGRTANEIDSKVTVGSQTADLYDIGMAALIMHDIVKDGDPGRTLPKVKHKMVAYHGVELMEAIRERVLKGQPPTLWQALIMYGVSAHMGRWTLPFEFAPGNLKGSLERKVAWLVHIADYCASRRLDEVVPALAKTAV